MTIIVIIAAFVTGFMLGCHIGLKAGLLKATQIMDEMFPKK